jgi:DNA-binding transcriptional MerR regulator
VEDVGMDEAERWTMDELVQRARLALSGSIEAGTYPGASNGRVRELPDQRAIRWYTGTGLVDRPFGGRGRGARYGVRHLRQLVAVKLLQARGLTLAEIQGRLAGVADGDLAVLAPLPPAALAPLASAVPAAAPRVDVAHSSDRRFWAVTSPAVHVPTAGPTPPVAPVVEPLTGVRLAPGVLLVLPREPSAGDLAALSDAARPLLAVLADRGLITLSASPAEATEGAPR